MFYSLGKRLGHICVNLHVCIFGAFLCMYVHVCVCNHHLTVVAGISVPRTCVCVYAHVCICAHVCIITFKYFTKASRRSSTTWMDDEKNRFGGTAQHYVCKYVCMHVYIEGQEL